ncbi:MAG: hypothetical protein COA43_02235 [Robiginitomaculum sp.]|nr:MAG: hypothetical protein COA43_02235 [Robiginitomaculum sp.]
MIIELKTWVPVIVSFIAILSAFITYSWQKHVDRKTDLLKQRQQVYIKLLVSLTRQIVDSSPPNLAKLNEARAELFLVASDQVAISTGRFFKAQNRASSEEKSQGSVNNPDKILNQYTEMVFAMRKDCFEKSKLDILQAVDGLPIHYYKVQERTIVQ